MLEFPKEVSGSTDGKNFLKLKDGETVKTILRGKVKVIRQHWNGNTSALCTGKADCLGCKEGTKPKFRFRVNAVRKMGEINEVKILEQGWTVFEALKGYNDAGIDLERTPLQITRRGSGKNDTTYIVVPMVNSMLTTEQEDNIKKLTLFDLDNLDTFPGKAGEPEAVPMATEEDIPF